MLKEIVTKTQLSIHMFQILQMEIFFDHTKLEQTIKLTTTPKETYPISTESRMSWAYSHSCILFRISRGCPTSGHPCCWTRTWTRPSTQNRGSCAP